MEAAVTGPNFVHDFLDILRDIKIYKVGRSIHKDIEQFFGSARGNNALWANLEGQALLISKICFYKSLDSGGFDIDNDPWLRKIPYISPCSLGGLIKYIKYPNF